MVEAVRSVASVVIFLAGLTVEFKLDVASCHYDERCFLSGRDVRHMCAF